MTCPRPLSQGRSGGSFPTLELGRATPSVPLLQHYLEDPIKGLEAPALGWPIRAHSVDIDALLQEAIRDAETKVIPHGVLVEGHLRAGGRSPWSAELCSQPPLAAGTPWSGTQCPWDPAPVPWPSCTPTLYRLRPCSARSRLPLSRPPRSQHSSTVEALRKGVTFQFFSVLLPPSRRCQWGTPMFSPPLTLVSQFTKELASGSEVSEGYRVRGFFLLCGIFYIYRWQKCWLLV